MHAHHLAEHDRAALCLATILATPYSLDYDLMIAAPAIALLASIYVLDIIATVFLIPELKGKELE